MEKGYVYIMTNASFQEDWVKIGRTDDLQKRVKDLSNKTCLPYAFEVYATCKTCMYKELEQQIHALLDKYRSLRLVPNREFFRLPPQEALKELRFLARTIQDAVIDAPGEKVEQEQHGKPAPAFRFSMVGIKPDEELIFVPRNFKVLVKADKCDNKIEFEGKQYTLSGFCKEFMPDEKRNTTGAYQGPAYFSYKGKLLVRLRAEMEELNK